MTRLAIIKREKCNPNSCGQHLCVKLCPPNRNEEECIVIGKDNKPYINEELCVGCGICSKRCPKEAIEIINLPEQLKTEPIHQFGKNAFELFSLPVPKKESVIGIIGRNGIGKSTALDILSGNLKPNLGKYGEGPNPENVLNRYSKSILGKYFKKLFDGKIKVSYKPQRIELISKLYNGKVIDLIKKVDEKGISDKLIKELSLENVEDRKVSELSGGELQKVAIIACLCKRADVYYLDEPMSFLDIIHRIKVAKIIRELKESFIVVEHDLASLDYISDEMQIVYGEAGCYGVFSQSKAVRRGINEYLDGYLPDDNVRFRDYKIIFNKFGVDKEISDEVLIEFDELEKKFEKFSLKTNKGVIHKQEVLGVVGANGLGKTTFLKLLSKEIKPDKGNVKEIKISYKPQYIYSDIEGTVLENLQKAAKDEFNSGWYKQNILEKLGLDKILNNKIKNLSGGELQKFHVAITLSKDADLYTLDEPSAFIDVEDRLKVAEIIKEFILKKEKAAIVVDHDIQFIDYLSDSILVFEGESGKKGYVYSTSDKKEGMNRVLKNLGITYRRDNENNRPKINKPGSLLDKEQRSKGEYYYV